MKGNLNISAIRCNPCPVEKQDLMTGTFCSSQEKPIFQLHRARISLEACCVRSKVAVKYSLHREPHSKMDSVLALHPAASGLILGIPNNFSDDVAEID